MISPAAPLNSFIRSLASVRLGRLNRRSGGVEMSFEKYLQEPFENARETHQFRQFFAARWQSFVRENFASPAHVAVCFGVSTVTAQNWWDGLNAPQGWAVAKAMTDPATAQQAGRHLTCAKSNGESSRPK